MEISDFTPGKFDVDKKMFEKVNLEFLDVTPEDFNKLVKAIEGITNRQVIAEPVRKIESKEPEEEELREAILNSLSGEQKLTATHITARVFKKPNSKLVDKVKNMCNHLVDEQVLDQQRGRGGGILYFIVK